VAPFNPVAPVTEPDEVSVPEDEDEEDGGNAKRSSIDTTNRSKPLPVFVTNEPNAVTLRAMPKINNTSRLSRFFILKSEVVELG